MTRRGINLGTTEERIKEADRDLTLTEFNNKKAFSQGRG